MGRYGSTGPLREPAIFRCPRCVCVKAPAGGTLGALGVIGPGHAPVRVLPVIPADISPAQADAHGLSRSSAMPRQRADRAAEHTVFVDGVRTDGTAACSRSDRFFFSLPHRLCTAGRLPAEDAAALAPRSCVDFAPVAPRCPRTLRCVLRALPSQGLPPQPRVLNG
jgi:hypothetical protein